MKLSDFQGEAALDLLADLIEPVGEIASDKNIVKAYTEGNRFKAISTAIKSHKQSVIQILALLDGVPVEEYKVNVFTLPAKLLELLNDPEVAQLFTSQGQMGDAISSGSVSANAEE